MKQTQNRFSFFHFFRFISQTISFTLIIILMMLVSTPAKDNFNKKSDALSSATVFTDFWTGKDNITKENKTIFIIQINSADLTYFCKQNKFNACYHVEVSVYDQHGILCATEFFRDSISVPSFELTNDDNQYRLVQIPINLKANKYRAHIRIKDDNSQKQKIIEKTFCVNYTDDQQHAVSDILLAAVRTAKNVDENQQTTTGIIPFPLAVYGKNKEQLYYYFEVYTQAHLFNRKIKVVVSCQDPNGMRMQLLQKNLHMTGSVIPVFSSFSTADFLPGFYKLTGKIYSPNGECIHLSQKDFYVYQDPMDLRFKSFEQILKEISLIATNEEIENLRNISAEQKQAELINFWKMKDPTPQSETNELKDEFYDRVQYARKHYWRGSSKKGDFSDQGKIFIIYGVPDNIVRQTDPINDCYYEIWTYRFLQLEVIFQDEFGFGEYRLVQPYSFLIN